MAVEEVATKENTNLFKEEIGKKGRLDVLKKEDFLNLLIAQLKAQNPLEPMGNIEFISQLAQFSSLEQMQYLNEKFDRFLNTTSLMPQVLPLLGKNVVTTVLDGNGDPIKDIVSKIRFDKGRALLTVGGKEVGLEHIEEVSI